MNAKDHFKAGRLLEARELLIEEVKSTPADIDKRTFLFQVLVFCGELNKAERHLDIIVAQDPNRETGVQVFKNLIRWENERMEIFKHHNRPSFLPRSPLYIETFYEGLEKLRTKKVDEAKEILGRVETQLPELLGTLNGKNFIGFRNTDIFVSLFLEAFTQEGYICIPFETIKELSVTSPKTLFDLLWVSACLTTWDGIVMNCYLPVLYSGSFNHKDERVRLGRVTDWEPLDGQFSKGSGQIVFQVGEEEIPILEIREVVFKTYDTVENK